MMPWEPAVALDTYWQRSLLWALENGVVRGFALKDIHKWG